MNNELTESEIIEIRNKYKAGTKIKLLKDMKEEPSNSVKAGEIGIVDHVDDIGTIHIRWENGSGLGLIPKLDEFEILSNIDDKNIEQEELEK